MGKLNGKVDHLIRTASRDGIQNDPQLDQLSENLASLHMDSEDLKSGDALRSAQILIKDAETLCERAKKFDLVKRTTNAKQAVVNSLHFPSRTHRHHAIPENHSTTLGWIYEISSFQKWIEEEGGIFWIHGKPGSGKSTLMKFLADNSRTQDCVTKWAHPYKATIAAHYFCNLGTDMQKSLLGLMQTLVFEILCKSPTRIQSACPTRWEMALNDQHVFAAQKKYDREGQWTMEELEATIKRLAQNTAG